MARFRLVQIDGRTTYHHIGSSSSTSSYSWIKELEIAIGRPKEQIPCAGFRCTNSAYLGAHLKPKLYQEFVKVFSLGIIGGVPVVPCCRDCHDTRGGDFRIKATYAIIDPNASLDNQGYRR